MQNYVHMFEVKMSVSRPCKTSPLKYDARGPMPVSSFCKAIYLEIRRRELYSIAKSKKCTYMQKMLRAVEYELLFAKERTGNTPRH